MSNKKSYLYKFLNKDGEVIYVGKAKNLFHRMTGHFGVGKESWKQEVDKIFYSSYKCPATCAVMEIYFINKYGAKYNKDCSFGSINMCLTEYEEKWIEFNKETELDEHLTPIESKEWLLNKEQYPSPKELSAVVSIGSAPCLDKLNCENSLTIGSFVKNGYDENIKQAQKTVYNLFRNVIKIGENGQVLLTESFVKDMFQSNPYPRIVSAKYISFSDYIVNKDINNILVMANVYKDIGRQCNGKISQDEIALSYLVSFLNQFVKSQKKITLYFASKRMEVIFKNYLSGYNKYKCVNSSVFGRMIVETKKPVRTLS